MRIVKGALDRCFELIELLADGARSLRLSEIAERLDMPKSAAHRLLAHLAALGWVEQDAASGLYRLTLRLALVGTRFLHATRLPDATQPVLDRVARDSRELVRLTVALADGLAWIGSAQGAPPGLMYQPAMGGPVVLHATANGKAWLATLPDSQALALARKGGLGRRGQFGPKVLAAEGALRLELARTRRRGYGLADEEAESGVAAVAVAIRPAGHAPALGTISIAGPVVRVTRKRCADLAALLIGAAAELAAVWPLATAARATEAAQ